ncbi:TlpA family protein disulfide reductase [Horticoccus sp. 23ND18S-11]|uniref:TlpA family protein disulfide reductase n=1 Tax=Horticoccus sp. 23ND18S-11 TaxID=3391832 RepID=UPI0039C9A3CD
MSCRNLRAGHSVSRYVRLLAAVVATAAAAAVARADVKVGDVFPGLAEAGLVSLGTGEMPPTGGRIVLVDFWASWCTPCKASFSMMADLHREFSARGLVVAAIGVDEKPAAAVAFAKKLAPPFPTLHDREQKLVRAVVVPTMPTSYLLGRDGRVRFVHQGFHGDVTAKTLRQQIETLLAENN